MDRLESLEEDIPTLKKKMKMVDNVMVDEDEEDLMFEEIFPIKSMDELTSLEDSLSSKTKKSSLVNSFNYLTVILKHNVEL